MSDKHKDAVNKPRRPVTRLFGRFLFLDLFLDSKARPILIYTVIIIAIGTIIYHWLEGWGYLDSLYFVVVTLTTIGYGDLSPTTPLAKWITIFYGLNGVAILLMLFDEIRRVRLHNRQDETHSPEQQESE